MKFSTEIEGVEEQIIDLFAETFAASEGEDEGIVIRNLVRKLLSGTSPEDIYTFTAYEREEMVGGAIFSRLTYSNDRRSVFILSPMAVATERQGQGIGQALLNHALGVLKNDGIAVAITYGDPKFYQKAGFQPIDEGTAASPLPLSLPVGWIGQSLTDEPMHPLKGDCTCVEALNDPAIW